MRKIIIALAAIIISGPAFAQSQSGSVSQSGAQAGVHIGGSARQAPSAIGPGLTASGLSCSGSASIGGSGAGWGLSFGITKADKNCDAREDAKYMQAITGNGLAAKARLCMVADNREAFRLAGDPCPQDAQRRASPSAPAGKPKSFASMDACLAYAAVTPGVACRARK